MTMCQIPGCREQHGLVEGVCRVCSLGDTLLGLENEDLERVLRRVQPLAAATGIGSAPHHDRVLAVVLVIADPQSAWGCRVDHLKPDTPQWEAFWQDIGRPDEGLNGTSEALTTDECVQRACPTPRICGTGQRFRCSKASMDSRGWRVDPEPASDPVLDFELSRHDARPEPACTSCRGEGRTDEDGGCDGRGKRLTYGPPFTPGTLGPCPDYEPEPASKTTTVRVIPELKEDYSFLRPEPAHRCTQTCRFNPRFCPLTRVGQIQADIDRRADLLERLSPLDHPYPEEA